MPYFWRKAHSTSKEERVIRLLKMGCSVEQAAEITGLTNRTIRRYRYAAGMVTAKKDVPWSLYETTLLIFYIYFLEYSVDKTAGLIGRKKNQVCGKLHRLKIGKIVPPGPIPGGAKNRSDTGRRTIALNRYKPVKGRRTCSKHSSS